MGRVSKKVQKEKEFQAVANISRNTNTSLLSATPPIPLTTAMVRFSSPNSKIYMCDFAGGANLFQNIFMIYGVPEGV